MANSLIETKPSRTNFTREFIGAFEFDQFQLCSDPSIKKGFEKRLVILKLILTSINGLY